MRLKLLSTITLSAGLGLAAIVYGIPAYAQTVSTNSQTGNVTVTLTNGSTVTIPASLASQVIAAMSSSDPSAVEQQIAAIVKANAASDVNLAAAIYVLADSITNVAALQAAAYAGVVAGNPNAATEVADNGSPNGAPAGGGGGATVVGSTGSTSGSGPAPSANTP